jgi:hypothetical protein
VNAKLKACLADPLIQMKSNNRDAPKRPIHGISKRQTKQRKRPRPNGLLPGTRRNVILPSSNN